MLCPVVHFFLFFIQSPIMGMESETANISGGTKDSKLMAQLINHEYSLSPYRALFRPSASCVALRLLSRKLSI